MNPNEPDKLADWTSAELEQTAFETWLQDKCPSGDVESVQRQWIESYEYVELLELLERTGRKLTEEGV